MGVDAYIFDRKSKRYYSYDREYNLAPHFVYDYLPEEDQAKVSAMDDIRYALLADNAKIKADQVVELCDFVIKGWAKAETDQDRGRAFAGENVKLFVAAFPEGEFFIRVDYDDAYEYMKDCGLSKWSKHPDAGQYEEWKP